jgi:hypothetical protein
MYVNKDRKLCFVACRVRFTGCIGQMGHLVVFDKIFGWLQRETILHGCAGSSLLHNDQRACLTSCQAANMRLHVLQRNFMAGKHMFVSRTSHTLHRAAVHIAILSHMGITSSTGRVWT